MKGCDVIWDFGAKTMTKTSFLLVTVSSLQAREWKNNPSRDCDQRISNAPSGKYWNEMLLK